MKKFIMLSALVAATSTAFVACSSDDDLAQQPKAPETVKGTPFSVVVNNEDGSTRATLIDGTTLANFKLFAKQEGASDSWIDGNVFKYESSQWKPYNAAGDAAVSDLTWPTENTSTASTFYAYSDNSTTGVTVNASPTTSCITTDNLATGSFVYQMATKSSTLFGGTGYTSGEANNVVDLEEQHDLLVAMASQTEEVNSGTVPLIFRHALASLAFKVRFTYNETSGRTAESGAFFRIFWIRIRGLKGGGTFTFPTISDYNDYNTTTHRWGTSPWTTDGGSEVVYEKVFGDNYNDLQTFNAQDAEGSVTPEVLTAHTDMLVFPQSFTPWTGNGNVANCYVEICLRGNSGSGKVSQAVYYMPFTISSTSNTILTGVKHTITLNLNYIASNNGTYLFDNAEGGGQGGARSFDEEIEW